MVVSGFAQSKPIDTTVSACKIPGCVVTCYYKDLKKTVIVDVDAVKISIYASGITKFELNKGMDGSHTIIVGPESYMCHIENQK